MFRNVEGVMEFCTKEDIKFIDFKISDFSGKWHHLSIPADKFCEKVITDGIGFDGSSYGLLTVEKSDMVFIPDINTAFIDPFCRYKTLSMIGNIYTLDKGIKRYENDPRYIAEKAEKYMHQTGIADENIIGPEFEFYIFDHISYNISPNNISMNIDSAQAEWNAKNEDVANLGYKVPHKGGYHIGLPYDVTNDIRSQMSLMLESLGIPVKYHHHESGGPGQVEIEVESGSMKDMADKTLILKYVVKNTAIQNSKSVTFMPKPILGEAGNGMHVHM